MNLPIRVRLTLWFAGLLAAIVTCLGSFLVLQLQSDLRMAMDEEIQTSSVSVLRAFTDERRGTWRERTRGSAEESDDLADAARASLPPSGGAQVLDAPGRVACALRRGRRRRPPGDRTELRAALAGLAPTRSVPRGDEGQQYRTRRGPSRIAASPASLSLP